MRFYLFVLMLLLPLMCSVPVCADVIKPALVEITAKHGGEIHIEMRVSIEALLTGINAQYKNTQDAPQAAAYDKLRVMSSAALAAEFEPFKARLLQQIRLQADAQPVALNIIMLDIPAPGYTQVPRASLIVLQGQIERTAAALRWYYPAAFGDNAVRVRQVDEARERWHWSDWQWLRNDEPSQPFSLTEVFRQPSVGAVLMAYGVLGFEHIIPLGVDHILFIIGIFLFSARLKPLFWQVTMFTSAHTLTLGLSINGVLNLPTSLVEPLIALSIAYIGLENILSRQRLPQRRLLLVFVFGLLHGLGFAGVLAEFGMPEDAFFLALLGFNVGVELGQLAIILCGWLLLELFGCGVLSANKMVWGTSLLERQAIYQKVLVIPASLCIMAIGLYWTVERLVVF